MYLTRLGVSKYDVKDKGNLYFGKILGNVFFDWKKWRKMRYEIWYS